MRGIGLKKTLHDPRILAKVERAISRLTTLLLPYQGAMTAARNYRAEPVFVCLYGGSAVGKTTLVTKLACAILVKSGLTPAKFALINLWQKGTTEFWNGYCNQKCLVMDDCFQLLPVKGADDNEYINVIRMVGNWAYALNFADIESKGKFYFDTPLVVGTTNCSSIANMAGNVVTCPEAVVRRIKHPYELCVTEGYRTEEGTLDYARIEREFNDNLTKLREEGNAASEAFLDAYPWDAWYLRSHNYTDGTCTGPMRSVRDLIEEVVQDLVTSAERHKAGLENLAYFL
jgi:energy-coupling factor transporter ATP-binding protein EcfA2